MELIWLVLYGFYVHWWLLPIDELRGRYARCRLHWADHFELTVSSRQFAEEFVKLNPAASVRAFRIGLP